MDQSHVFIHKHNCYPGGGENSFPPLPGHYKSPWAKVKSLETMAGSSSFRPNFFFFLLHPRAFPSSCFHSPTEQKKKKKQNTYDPCFSKARINGRQKYTKANYKTWHEHAHSARLHATRGRFRADQSASMIAVANKHGVCGGMCTSAGSR